MPQPAPDPSEAEMSFGEHLDELRRRLIHALIGVAVAACVTFYYAREIFEWLCQPLFHAQAQASLPQRLVNLNPTGAFSAWVLIALASAAVLAAPWVVYQIWLFVAAGLYPHERRAVIVLAPFSLLMTVLGILFFYYVILPAALVFLIGFAALDPTVQPPRPSATQPSATQPSATQPSSTQPAGPEMLVPVLPQDPSPPAEGQLWFNSTEKMLKIHVGGRTLILAVETGSIITPLITAQEYLGFTALLALGITIAFQLPVVMTFLGGTGMINPADLSRARRYVIFGCGIAAAFLTPTTDPLNMALLGVPLWLLFEFGLVLMRVTYRYSRRRVAG